MDTQGVAVERLEDGRMIIHHGDRRLELPADTSPDDLTREIRAFVRSARPSTWRERLAESLAWSTSWRTRRP